MPTSDKPSILAASMISFGKLLAACLNIIIRNGVARPGSTKAGQVFTSPTFENMVKSGIIVATKGSIIAVRSTVKRTSFDF